MTTAASFTSLHAPVADDNMEMSSPAHALYDDDAIDIEFDDHIGGVELTDDDRMADDTEQPRPGTATDDMMEDDAPLQDGEVPEQEMQDDFDPAAYEQADPDDELIDYGDDEYQDMSEVKEQTVFEPTAPEITLEDREPTDPGFEQVDEEIVREPETSAPAQEVVIEESAPEVVPAVSVTSGPEVVVATVAEETFAEAVNDTSDHNNVEADANATEYDVFAATDDHHIAVVDPVEDPVEEPFPELPEDSPELKTVAPVPAPLDTNPNLDAGNDAPATPTDTGLHPMFVQYGDWVWPLFKSRKQPEGLLKDDNLASVALADLLDNCRSRLALKVGEDISEDQEFVLCFDSIGLNIIENSPSAFNTSLDEVLAVFKQLHVNDRAQSIPPLWMSLSSQTKPSSYLAMLKQAAARGQGISDFEVSADEVLEDFGEYYQEGDEDPTLLGDGSGIEYEDEAQPDGHQPHAEPEVNEANHHEYDASYENTEGGQEPHEGHGQDDHYDEAQQAEYETQHAEFEAQQAEFEAQQAVDDAQQAVDDAQQAVDDAQQAEYEACEDNEDQHADVAAEHAEGANDVQQSEEAKDPSHVDANTVSIQPNHEVEPPVAVSAPYVTENTNDEAFDDGDKDQDPARASNAESTASSTTLRVDQANDAVGEYKDEDLIDWNDSTLTTHLSEHNADETDDFSTFLAENGLEDFADIEVANEENQRTAETGVNTAVATGDEYDHVADGHKVTIDFDFEVDEFEHHPAEAGEDAPAKAVDGIANGELQEQPETPAYVKGDADPGSELKVSAVAERPQAEGSPSEKPVRNEEDYIDFDDEDDIDFDDDTYEQHEARMASEHNTPGSKSPSGKRPLDEAGDTEQPELKKVKSS